jgi:hypothetical protein
MLFSKFAYLLLVCIKNLFVFHSTGFIGVIVVSLHNLTRNNTNIFKNNYYL